MLSLGVAATRAPWSASLRSYVRDHTQGISVEVVMDRAGLKRSAAKLDVLVLDDVMRLFSIPDLVGVQEQGVHVIGLYDQSTGMGRQYLAGLGADQLLPATIAPGELVEAMLQIGPRERGNIAPGESSAWRGNGPERGHLCGLLTAWAKVSGGTGLTEAVIAVAERLARGARVLVIEADEGAPVMASRLQRSVETGLAWAASRITQGQPAFPEALCGARRDGPGPL
ncbi:MAG TPA: hypothetical protein VED59_06965, partial [Acidimicrobiales bacterium]|nr:hypothetical protein [Acidimicrobiales bacterium]